MNINLAADARIDSICLDKLYVDDICASVANKKKL